jgi:hypothetical protein
VNLHVGVGRVTRSSTAPPSAVRAYLASVHEAKSIAALDGVSHSLLRLITRPACHQHSVLPLVDAKTARGAKIALSTLIDGMRHDLAGLGLVALVRRGRPHLFFQYSWVSFWYLKDVAVVTIGVVASAV